MNRWKIVENTPSNYYSVPMTAQAAAAQVLNRQNYNAYAAATALDADNRAMSAEKKANMALAYAQDANSKSLWGLSNMTWIAIAIGLSLLIIILLVMMKSSSWSY